MMRALLVDDHAVVRAGLKALLEASGTAEVVGEASSGEEAVAKARSLAPDIVVMDLAMPGMDGIQATRRIVALGIETKILVLTIHDEDEFLLPALEAGADGFLKSAADTDLMGAIEAVVRGDDFVPLQGGGLFRMETRPSVWVLDDDRLARARELAAEFGSGPAAGGEPETWRCRCGETVEAQFSECWSCGRARPGEA